MKALVKAYSKPGIWMQDVKKPTCGPNDVLVKIRKTAICGTDIHIYHWDDWAKKTVPVPMTIGHEYCGEIVELGEQVQGLSIGQRVSGEGHIVCGQCRNCRGGRQHLCPETVGIGVNRTGCFGEYVAVPASNIVVLPEGISDEIAAVLDPFGNAAHCALSFDLVGEDVLITGAGPVGIFAVAIARFIGARHIVITDVNPFRLKLAQQMGATRAINVLEESLDEVMASLGMKEGFDVGLEMAGNPSALQALLKAMTHGGKVALLGIPPAPVAIDWNDVIFKGLFLKGIYGREMYETWYKMIAMLESGLSIDPMITHHFHVDEYEEAFEVMASGQSGKVILNWL